LTEIQEQTNFYLMGTKNSWFSSSLNLILLQHQVHWRCYNCETSTRK